jgi:hypothetical protein
LLAHPAIRCFIEQFGVPENDSFENAQQSFLTYNHADGQR